jgi:nucleolar GTP-binding protein
MFTIPTVLTSEEILDMAFKRAQKVQVTARSRLQRQRKTASAKIIKAQSTIVKTLGKYVKSFPSFDTLPMFYYELFDVTVGIDNLKKSLGALDWAANKVRDIGTKARQDISMRESKDEIKSLVSSSYGRFSSVLKQISGDLEFLSQARMHIIKAPDIDSQKPTIVTAGAPNVGKSLLVKIISTAKPKIASYPFTTKGISVGHFEDDNIIFQIIDTPGLLDRDFELRNEMEKKAILALRHLAHLILFILDPSEYCGYTTEAQLAILSDIKSNFPDIPVLEVENKMDLANVPSKRLKISALEGEGVERLREVIVEKVREASDKAT